MRYHSICHQHWVRITYYEISHHLSQMVWYNIACYTNQCYWQMVDSYNILWDITPFVTNIGVDNIVCYIEPNVGHKWWDIYNILWRYHTICHQHWVRHNILWDITPFVTNIGWYNILWDITPFVTNIGFV